MWIGLLAAASVVLSMMAGAPAASAADVCALDQVCEAELGSLHDGAGTEDEHAGYTGTGFVDQLFGNAGVVLEVDAPESGTHRVTVRYANGNPGDGTLVSRRFTLTVNGTTDIPVLFPTTNSWTTWSTVQVLVPLTAGTNQLDFHTGPENNGPINIDHVVVSRATEITEEGVTLRIFDVATALQELCTLKPGQTPNVDVLRPTIDWTTASDWGGYTSNYLAQVVADLEIAAAGSYTFRLLSDDGARLYLDGEEIIDHDGVHGPTTMDGEVALTAGSHALEIRYFQAGGGARLQLQWRPPGETTFETVPTSVFSVEGGGARVVSPGVKECENLSDQPGDGSPLNDVHPSFDLSDLRPDALRPDVSGIAWYPDGSAAVLTWGAAQTSSNGTLYRVANIQGAVDVADVEYREVATGLQEPQGVAVVDGATFVSTKAGLDRLVDVDGDGFFEGRERLASWPYANSYHEFAFGLPYRDGHFYVALSGALDRAGLTLLPQPARDRGTIAKVNKDTGVIEYIAGGLRTPNGISFGPDGRLLVTDNQGGWVPTSKLVEIKEGAFYNMFTTFRDPDTGTDIPGRFDDQPVTPPVVWMPHNEIANSPSTPVVMDEGLFAGQLAIGDVTYGGLQRVFLEEVDGVLQGGLYRMTQGLEAGINEVAVGPDGDLYLGGIGYDGNWGQPGKLRYGLQKLTANDTVTMDILTTEITESGFDLTYTKPLSAETRQDLVSKYQVEQWRYNATSSYGGPKLGQESLAVVNATVGEDGKTVSLEIPGVKPGHVVHIRSPRPFSAEDGEQLWSTEVWYTANAVPGYQPPEDLGFYEAEEAVLSNGASINNDHSKYSGSGFVDGFTNQGATLTFDVTADDAGTHPVHLRYANGPNPFTGPKTVSLYVNGTEVDPLVLPSTGEWQTWAFITRQLDLQAGRNTISIRYEPDDDGWVNFDVLKVGEGNDICAPQTAEAGYTSLFDGTLESLTAWRHASGGSFARLADCSLKTVGDIGMLWYPQQQFDGYSLKLDWKMAGDDNSGVFVGFPDPGNDWNVAFTRGHEIQIDATDDADSTTGAIYNHQAPDAQARDEALNPPGQWNEFEIIVEGQRIQVFLNGVKINDYVNTDPNRMTVPGYIGVQNHGIGDDVFFRNIRIKDLDSGGGSAPSVQGFADPASGRAPLRVRFRAEGSDADGDPLSYVWEFGDGGMAGGPQATHVYTQPGTYTATVTVSDASGATGSASVQIVVSAPAAAPPMVAPPNPVPAPEAAGDVPGEGATVRAVVRAPRSVRALRRRGVRVRVTCVADGDARAVLNVARKHARRLGLRTRTLAVRTVDCAAGQTVKMRLRPRKAARRKLRGERAIRLVLRVGVEGAEPVTRRFTIR